MRQLGGGLQEPLLVDAGDEERLVNVREHDAIKGGIPAVRLVAMQHHHERGAIGLAYGEWRLVSLGSMCGRNREAQRHKEEEDLFHIGFYLFNFCFCVMWF